MTLVARLCALCAVCALAQMVLGDANGRDGLRMISGLLMLHLVISGAQELWENLVEADGMMHIFQILMG